MTALALTALAPSEAAADDCMCFAVPDLGGVNAARVPQSVEVGPFFSSDGTMLTSRQLEREIERHFGGQHIGGTAASEILWCWSPDDPRCSPTNHSPDDTPRALRSGQSGVAVEHRLSWPALLDDPLARGDARLLGPADGVHARVERPPRA